MVDDVCALHAYLGSSAFSLHIKIRQNKLKKNKKFCSACFCNSTCVVGVLTAVKDQHLLIFVNYSLGKLFSVLYFTITFKSPHH